MANFKNTRINTNEAIGLPSGTSAERPSSPVLGMMRYNTEEEIVEVYNGEEWITVGTTPTQTQLVKVSLSNNNNVNNTSSFNSLSVFNTDEINEGGFTVSNSGIVVPDNGIYLCSFSCKFFCNSGSREAPGVRFSINGSGQGEISRSSYMRQGSGHDESSTSLTTLYSLASGDELGLQFSDLNGYTATVDLNGSNSIVMIERVE